MVAKDEHGKNAQVPGLILKTKDDVRRFARSIKRQEQAKTRVSTFKSSEFQIDDYLELIKMYNAQVEI